MCACVVFSQFGNSFESPAMRDPSAVAFVRKPSEEMCTHYIPFTAPASYTGSKLHVRDVAMKSAGLLEDAKVFLLSE